MKQTFLATLFLTGLLPLTSFAQGSYPSDPCLGRLRGIPPNTSTIVGGGDLIDFNVERGTNGTDGFVFGRNGVLTYQDQKFRPSVLVGPSISALTFFEIRAMCVSLAIPKQRPSNTITTLYILNQRNLSSRQVKIDLSSPLKSNWNSANKNAVTLCESNGSRFIRVNTKTGAVLKGGTKQLGGSPCLK
jgi:hypothetical protein